MSVNAAFLMFKASLVVFRVVGRGVCQSLRDFGKAICVAPLTVMATVTITATVTALLRCMRGGSRWRWGCERDSDEKGDEAGLEIHFFRVYSKEEYLQRFRVKLIVEFGEGR